LSVIHWVLRLAVLANELHIASDVKRCLKIILLVGVVTIFLTPDDSDPDPVPVVIEAVASERATVRFSLSALDILAEPRSAKQAFTSIGVARAYSTQSCSIIDITCARLC
jgi:hypothetical protein